MITFDEYVQRRLELPGRKVALKLLTGSEQPDNITLLMWERDYFREMNSALYCPRCGKLPCAHESFQECGYEFVGWVKKGVRLVVNENQKA